MYKRIPGQMQVKLPVVISTEDKVGRIVILESRWNFRTRGHSNIGAERSEPVSLLEVRPLCLADGTAKRYLVR